MLLLVLLESHPEVEQLFVHIVFLVQGNLHFDQQPTLKLQFD